MDYAEISDLYQEHADAIYGYLVNLTRSAEDAQDLVQEVFVSALRYFDGERIENHKGWLFKIAYNQYINYLKKGKKSRFDENIDAGAEQRSAGPGVAEQVEWKILRERILQSLAQSNDIYVHVFILRLDSDLSHDEIAASLAMSSSTYFRHLEKIRTIIRQGFGKDLPVFLGAK